MRDLDLLLINRSNYPTQPIFPYAFVQVSALAQRQRLSVERFECLGRDDARIRAELAQIIADRRPRAIGITLRQCDSMLLGDYWTPLAPQAPATRGYFPLEDTVDLVQFLRTITDARLIVGGAGFSIHAERLMHVVQPDLGVVNEPDGMFEAFEDLLAGRRLDEIPNLLYWEGGQVKKGPHRLFDSPRHTEYTDEIVAELKAFYGGNLPSQTVAVELARGCPYRCFFCVEPVIKGRSVRQRPLEIVIEELERLIRHDLTSFWLVCSELNMGNADLAMEVAEAMTRLRERHPTKPVTWRAYVLPRWLSTEHGRVLARAGFVGGWNDFPSLDDANLRACGVPYRTTHAVQALVAEAEAAEQKGAPVSGSMFFGNAHMDPTGVARTLKAFNDANLCNRYDAFYPITSTRMFEVPAMEAFRNCAAVTFTRSGRSDRADVAHPTHFWSEALVAQLGSVPDVEEFFLWMVRAFLFKDPARHFTLLEVLRTLLPAEVVSTLLHERPLPPGRVSLQDVAQLYGTETGPAAGTIADVVFRHLVADVDRAEVWDAIGVPHRAGELEGTPYAIECLLLSRFASWDALDHRLVEHLGDRAARPSPIWIYCRGQLFQKGVRLRPAYVSMIVPPDASDTQMCRM